MIASLAPYVALVVEALDALAAADAAIVEAAATRRAAPRLAADLWETAGALRGFDRAWTIAATSFSSEVTPPPWPLTLAGIHLAPGAYADALDEGAGIGLASGYAEGLKTWWTEAQRCFEA